MYASDEVKGTNKEVVAHCSLCFSKWDTTHCKIVHQGKGKAKLFCPFCDTDTYTDFKSLTEHVATQHPGCKLILPDGANYNTKAPVNEFNTKDVVPKPVPPTYTPKTTTIPWKPITHPLAPNLSSFLPLLTLQIQQLSSAPLPPTSPLTHSESRLYKRGLRDRVGMAESERNEKQKHAAECEQAYLLQRYENRYRKKSRLEVEEGLIVGRPVVWERERARSKSKEDSQCSVTGCSLCNGEYAKVIDFDETSVVCPVFRKIEEEEWGINTTQINMKKEVDTEEGEKKSMTKEEEIQALWKLQELKDTLTFVQEYNEGPKLKNVD